MSLKISQTFLQFIEIQDDIVAYAKSFYYLYYMSPKRGGNIHSLRLLVKENSNNSSSGYIDGEFSSEGFYSVEQGIVLNNGNENISLIYNDESYVTAFTYLATNNPSYVWESSNNDVFTVHPDNNDNSRCIIKAAGNVGQTASLTVNDVSNSLMKSVVIEIAPNPYGEITDPRDGTTYKTVEIDGSLWIAENMRFEITPGSYVYDNDESNLQMLGRLYTWEKATLACPEGWHLPTNNDWQYLINYLGGNAEAGGKLKEQGTSNWKNPNSFATNESYFSARPGGFRNTDGTFVNKGEKGYFWSATNLNEIEAYSRGLSYDRKSVSVETSHKGIGFSVRCVKDQ